MSEGSPLHPFHTHTHLLKVFTCSFFHFTKSILPILSNQCLHLFYDTTGLANSMPLFFVALNFLVELEVNYFDD